jgi:hypothetical protein
LPARRHSIALDVTGNAKKWVEDLAKRLKSARGDLEGLGQVSVKDVTSAIQEERTERGYSKSREEVQQRRTSARQRAAQQQMQQGQVAAAQATGLAATAAGGGVPGLLGQAAGGLGRLAGKAGLGGAAAGLAAGGAMIAVAGQMADSFTSVAEQYGKVAAYTRGFRKTLTESAIPVAAAAEAAGMRPEMVRRMMAMVAAQGGDVTTGLATTMGEVSRAFGLQADQIGQFMATQRRFGFSEDITKRITQGLRAGLDIGQLNEHLRGVQTMQEDLIRVGITNQGDVGQVLTELGAMGEAWKGQYGAQRAMGMTQAFRTAASGGGGSGANMLYAAISQHPAFKNLSHYQRIEQMEKGATDSDNLAAVHKYIKDLTTDTDIQARRLQDVFQNMSFTEAKSFMQNYQQGRPARSAADAKAISGDQIDAYRDSALQERMEADASTALLSEDIRKSAADIVDSVVTTGNKIGEQVASGFRPMAMGLNFRELTAYARLNVVGGNVRRRMGEVHREYGIPPADIQAALAMAIVTANEGRDRVTREERREAETLFLAEMKRLVALAESDEGYPISEEE